MITAPSPPVSPSPAVPSAGAAPRLLDQVRQALQSRRYNPRTEEIFVKWIRRFVVFHDKRHPRQLREAEVVRFLSALALDDHVSLSAQAQARAALVFLYRYVLNRPLGRLDEVVRAGRLDRPGSRGVERRPPDRDEILTAKPDPLR